MPIMVQNGVESRISLVPWDFNSREHTKRMYFQRVSCGWMSDAVEDWIQRCQAGMLGAYWVVSLLFFWGGGVYSTCNGC